MSSTTAIRRASRASDKYREARSARATAIRDAIDAGATVTEVAAAVGVTRAAIYKMLQRERRTDG